VLCVFSANSAVKENIPKNATLFFKTTIPNFYIYAKKILYLPENENKKEQVSSNDFSRLSGKSD